MRPSSFKNHIFWPDQSWVFARRATRPQVAWLRPTGYAGFTDRQFMRSGVRCRKSVKSCGFFIASRHTEFFQLGVLNCGFQHYSRLVQLLLCQFCIFSSENCLKSLTLRVTRVRSFTVDMAAICPSTKDRVKPFDINLARSFACHSAALSS